MELNRFSILPVKASEAKSSLCCVEIQSNAPPNPNKMPKTFLPVTFSFRNKAEIKKTHIGCVLLKMAADTGVVVLRPT